MKQKNLWVCSLSRGIVPGENIRVVKIPGIDVQACAGTHVLRTGDVGL